MAKGTVVSVFQCIITVYFTTQVSLTSYQFGIAYDVFAPVKYERLILNSILTQ